MTGENLSANTWKADTTREVRSTILSLPIILWSLFLIFTLVLLVATNLLNVGNSTNSPLLVNRKFRPLVRCVKNPTIKMITKVTLLLLIASALVAFFLSYLVARLNTATDLNNVFVVNSTSIENDHASVLDQRPDNLFWFVQISDTHLSFYQNKERETDLYQFCQTIVPMIKPPVLLLTGDITDARSRDPMGSGQHKTEWLIYDQVRKECLLHNPNVKWLDIKGNHDNFNVYNSVNNYYSNYTVQANMSEDGRSYLYTIESGGKKYSFLGADACLKPGLRRPFNFVGRFDEQELQRIIKLRRESSNSDYVVWFGHYPTSSIANNNDFRALINGPYLCGHFHTASGLARQMISTQPNGYLEAELSDWKDIRTFRILAIDGGLFTFQDYYFHKHKEKPLIVITNPRSVLHQMEHIEPYWRTSRSTHLRALVFSHTPLIYVRAFITKEVRLGPKDPLESFELAHVEGPLWVAKWDPSKYQHGLFYITVVAMNDHFMNEVSVPFSMDKSKPAYPFFSRLVLRIDFKVIGIFLFITGMMMALIPLIVTRFSTTNDPESSQRMFSLSRRSYFQKLCFKLYLLVHIDRIFFPVILIPLYCLIGPWFIGHFVLDHIGMAFIWGQVVDGQFLPVGFTYVFGFVFLWIFFIPFEWCLAGMIHSRYMKLRPTLVASCQSTANNINLDKNNEPAELAIVDNHEFRFCDYVSFELFLLLSICILQALFSTLFYFAYGYLAQVTNFFLWAAVFYVILATIVLKLGVDDFKKCDPIAYRTFLNN